MNEKGFENWVKESFKSHWRGSKCIKIASGYIGGLPDLYMKPTWMTQSAWVELKFVRLNDKPKEIVRTAPVSFDLTLRGMQRRFIETEHDAGGVAGWMVLVQLTEFDTVMLSGVDPHCKEIPLQFLLDNGCHGRLYQRNATDLRKLIEKVYDGSKARNSI